MKKLSVFFLLILVLLQAGCKEDKLISGSYLDTYEVVEDEVKLKEQEQVNKLIPRYIEKNNRPYVIWNEVIDADQYRVSIKRESKAQPSYKTIRDRQIEVFPGETVFYQISPLTKDGKEMTDYLSDPLEVNYTIKGGYGGVEDWVRPDGFHTHRAKKEFPEGMYWSTTLADEITSWIKETYSTQYLLGGHIAEIDRESGEWIAPISPSRRVDPQYEGSGLDCVGFVNGFYYLYTQAFAGEDYKEMDLVMDETYGVYGSPFAPLAALGYSSHIVIKPSLGGSYADKWHIRPGDINESDDHAWLISHQGDGFDSKIWEYEYMNGFSDHRTAESIRHDSADNPHEYWAAAISNPLESYGKIKILALDKEGNPVEGGTYRLMDSYNRTMALEDQGSVVELYRPNGDDFFNLIFARGESKDFYDEESTFTMLEAQTSLYRVIGGRYILEEIMPPEGYMGLEPISIEIAPGEEKVIYLEYK
ncbi:MAG TPA: hypothetical protein VFD08_01705 [Clostridia bacterium]|nr:hypothetical protein [Clostridia bacterium]